MEDFNAKIARQISDEAKKNNNHKVRKFIEEITNVIQNNASLGENQVIIKRYPEGLSFDEMRNMKQRVCKHFMNLGFKANPDSDYFKIIIKW